MINMKRYEECVYRDLPKEKAFAFITSSERNKKLRYVAKPAESGKANHVDIWSYLKPGEEP